MLCCRGSCCSTRMVSADRWTTRIFHNWPFVVGFSHQAGSFGASVRQSQIGIQAFGPTIAGARTSADIEFDFAGGFPEAQNGASFGIVRLRTGTIRFDWTDTSVVGGQDSLFFAPLSPTSIANTSHTRPGLFRKSLELDATGSVEHKLLCRTPLLLRYKVEFWTISPAILLLPCTSGTPVGVNTLASRHTPHDFRGSDLFMGKSSRSVPEDITAASFGDTAVAWTAGRATMDLKLPLGRLFEFTSQIYRGRAVGALAGASDRVFLEWISV